MPYQGRAYYDEAYAREKLRNGQPNHYRGDWDMSPMLPVWKRVLAEMPNDHLVLIDLGCGTGQCMEAMKELHGKYLAWLGIDFSSEAMQLYWDSPAYRPGFDVGICAELHGINYKAYPCDLYIACETLEHLKDDIGLLRKLNSGTDIIITVPNHDDRGHVRFFKTEKQLRAHYGKPVNIDKVTFEGKHWLIKGVLK